MIVMAVDPGNIESAWVLFDSDDQQVIAMRKEINEVVLERVESAQDYPLVIERIASYGMPVGESIFETVYWSGRFCQAHGGDSIRITRNEIKNHICHSSRANDSHIRQALIDRFSTPEQPAIGLKKSPGPLFGVSKDIWAALAVAVTFADTRLREAA